MEPHSNAGPALPPPKWQSRIKRQQLRKYSWLPDVLRVKGSVIPQIIGPVFTVTVFSVMVVWVRSQGKRIELTNSVVPLLSVVVGLILVFRNSTSYDRYWEGRRCFSTLTANVRNLSRMIWVNVALPLDKSSVANTQAEVPNSISIHDQVKQRKIEILRYCLGFVYAVKHYVRGEDGPDYPDLRGFLPPHLTLHGGHGHPSVSSNTVMQGSTSHTSIGNGRFTGAAKRIKRKRSKSADPKAHPPDASTPLLSDFPYANPEPIPLPLIIAHEISSAIFRFKREGLLETVGPAGTNALNGLVQSMVDQMTCMERIANSPIPSSYGIHLKQCVTLYLFALPFTLMDDLGWMTIPIVTVVAFMLMGIEGIADEIQMPFGYDSQDLPLDTYCKDLKEEVEYMYERLAEGGPGTNESDDGEGDD